MILRPSLRWVDSGLLVIGLVLVGMWLKSYGEAHAFQNAQSRALDTAVREAEESENSSAVTPVNRVVAPAVYPGIGRIEIPRLGISAMIDQGVNREALQHAVGHIPSTAEPGQPGNVALAGHRETFFRALGSVRRNDLIRIETVHGTYNYRVAWNAVVNPQRTDLLAPTDAQSLTLVTCYPFHCIGPAPKRFVVRATLIDPLAHSSGSLGAIRNTLEPSRGTIAASAQGTVSAASIPR
jgi:sortase A